MTVYLPLRTDGSKRPAVAGWAEPEYRGVEPTGWVGLRCDDLVVIDCDSAEAYEAWCAAHPAAANTHTVKSPRGYHLYYRRTPKAPTGPAVGVLPDIDVRAGSGSYVVCPPTPGYEGDDREVLPFDSAWLPRGQAIAARPASDEWTVMPNGRRNSTLTRYAGLFRATGMATDTVQEVLTAINRLCCDPPLPSHEIDTIARSSGRWAPEARSSVLGVDDGEWRKWLGDTDD
jgi:hypothetical protein